MTETSTSEVGRAAIDAYLDSVEQALLAAQAPRIDRVQVLQDLESQIADMLAREPQPLTEEIVQSVIARLEPPSHFADMYGNGQQPQVARPSSIPARAKRELRWSYIAAACFALPVLGALLEWCFGLTPRNGGAIFILSIVATLFAVPGALTMAYRQVRARSARSTDRDLVLTMTMGYAIVAPAFLIIVFADWTYGLVFIPFGAVAFVYWHYKLVQRLHRNLVDALPPQSATSPPSESNPRPTAPVGTAMSLTAI